MCFLQNGNMSQRLVHLRHTHPVLLQFYYQKSHQERFCLHRSDPAQVHDYIAIKQLSVFQSILCTENISVNSCCQRTYTSVQSTRIIVLGIFRILRLLNDRWKNIHQIIERRVSHLYIYRPPQIPSCITIAPFHCILQNGRHRCIHRPAGIEDFHKPVNVLPDMNFWRECKWIYPQQRCQVFVCAIHLCFSISKNMLVLAFGWFNHKKCGIRVFCYFCQ